MLQTVELPYPPYVFVNADDEESDGSQNEWQYERAEIFHYPMISFVFVSIWRMLMMSERKFTPLGHTSVHFPHNMHFCSSCSRLSYWPLRKYQCVLRMLKSVNWRAVQEAVHPPQPMQRLYDGTASNNCRYFDKSVSESLIERVLEIENPNSAIMISILARGVPCLR